MQEGARVEGGEEIGKRGERGLPARNSDWHRILAKFQLGKFVHTGFLTVRGPTRETDDKFIKVLLKLTI